MLLIKRLIFLAFTSLWIPALAGAAPLEEFEKEELLETLTQIHEEFSSATPLPLTQLNTLQRQGRRCFRYINSTSVSYIRTTYETFKRDEEGGLTTGDMFSTNKPSFHWQNHYVFREYETVFYSGRINDRAIIITFSEELRVNDSGDFLIEKSTAVLPPEWPIEANQNPLAINTYSQRFPEQMVLSWMVCKLL
mgnify:CR=1 FL=1